MKIDYKLKFGSKLRKYRLINGISQEDFAAKLSISRGTLINYEKGHTKPSVDFILKIKSIYIDFDSEEYEDKENQKKIINSGYIDFLFLFKLLLNEKMKIFFSISIFLVSALVYIFFKPNLYQARLTLYPDNESQNNFGQFQNIVSNLGFPMQASQEHSFSIPDIIKSRKLKDAVLDTVWYSKALSSNVTLLSYWSLEKDFFSFLRFKKEFDLEKSLYEKGRDVLSSRINVNENRNTGLITITLNFEEPEMASQILGFISNNTQEFIQASILKKANREKSFIVNRLKLSKGEMVVAEETLKEFQNENRSIDKSPELQMIQNRLRRNVESKQMVVNTLEQQLEISRIEAERTKPVLYILDDAESELDPVKPRKFIIIFISIMLGFLCGLLFIILKK